MEKKYTVYLQTLTDLFQATLETTIGNSNNDLWKYVQPDNSVLEGIRVMAANRLATSGKAWTDMFTQYNSGT